MKKINYKLIIGICILAILPIFSFVDLPITKIQAAPYVINNASPDKTITNSINNGTDLTTRDVEITGTTVTMYGENSFNSLKITGNATVTHEAINKETDYIGLVIPSGAPRYMDFNLIPSAQQKKVDITVTNDLTIENGSKIDVTGKGYPGSPPNSHSWPGVYAYGAGPGGTDIGHHDSDGAGYGGLGGNGDSRYQGGIYGEPEIFTLWHGSGSGGGSDGREACNGATGGGAISLNIGNNLILPSSPSIIADGVNGIHQSLARGNVSSGGGSGGSVRIVFVTPNITNYKVNLSKGVGSDGGDGYLFISPYVSGVVDTANYQISAKGGNGGIAITGGGGGRVAIRYTAPVIVSKRIHVQVTWEEYNQRKIYDLNTILQNLQ